MMYATRPQRLLGQVLDGVVGAAPLILTLFVSPENDAIAKPIFIAALLWSVFYYFLADGLPGGRSVGKRWLGMRVVHADDGSPCTFLQSFVRNFLLAVLGPIDWLFIFGERHQRLGDKAAGTVVVVD